MKSRCPRGDSNTGIHLRRVALYPLSYGGLGRNSTTERNGKTILRRITDDRGACVAGYRPSPSLPISPRSRSMDAWASRSRAAPKRANWYFLKASSPNRL